MNNTKTLNFFGNLFGARAIGILLNLLRQIPFPIFEPAYFALIVLMIVLFALAVLALIRVNTLKKQSKIIEKDELSKKIGYTALAASTQITALVLLILLMINSFRSFLEIFSVQDVLLLVTIMIGVISYGAYLYYSKNPDKT